jgi:hypothetical protein
MIHRKGEEDPCPRPRQALSVAELDPNFSPRNSPKPRNQGDKGG